MLPERRSVLLLIFITLLFSCINETKNDRNSLQETVKASQDAPSNIAVDNKPGQAKKENEKKPTLKTRIKINNDSVVRNKITTEYKMPQSFLINPERDTTLNGEEGTVIKIKLRSFVYKGTDIDVAGTVAFHLSEYYKLSDIVAAGLSTESNGRILETGGMIFIEALSEGKQCELKNNSELEIQFPFTERKEGMQLFVGVKREEGKIDWVPESSEPFNKEPVVEAAGFPGESNAWLQMLNSNFTYPDSVADIGSFKLIVSFIIDTAGNTKVRKVLNSPSRVFDQMVTNAFSKMPKWMPEKRNGIPMEVSFVQPIYFYSGFDGENTFDSISKSGFEARVDDTNINELRAKEIRQYIFSSSKLGWINCDRFWKSTASKKDLLVRIKDYYEVDIKIIFHSFKGILEGTKTSLGYLFREIPEGENITVLAIAKKNYKTFIALNECKTNSVLPELTFEPVTLTVLKQKITKLNDR